MRVWAVGFRDAMAGREVEDTDESPKELGDALIVAAQQSIEGAETFIAEVFQENPNTVFQTVYNIGFETFININGITAPIEVYLN